MKRGVLTLAALASAAVISAQARPRSSLRLRYPEGIHWHPDVRRALAEAVARNAPLLVVCMKDGEKLCELMHRREHRDRRIIQLSRRFVCLLASRDTHQLVPGRGIDGRPRKVCSKYGCVTCAEHQKVELWAFRKFNQNGTVEVPWHVFCTPEGKVILRHRHDVSRSAEDLARAMERALELVGPGLDAASYRRLSAVLTQADGDIQAGRLGKALQRLRAVLRAGGRSALAGKAKARIEALEKEARSRLVEVDRLMTAGNYRAAKERARELSRHYRGLQAARLFQDRLRLLVGGGGRSAALLEKAERAFRQGDYLQAERLYRLLVARHGGTAQAARAQRQLRRLAEEPQLRAALARQRMERDCRQWLGLARALHAAGRLQAAREYLRRLLRTYPQSPFAREAKSLLQSWH